MWQKTKYYKSIKFHRVNFRRGGLNIDFQTV